MYLYIYFVSAQETWRIYFVSAQEMWRIYFVTAQETWCIYLSFLQGKHAMPLRFPSAGNMHVSGSRKHYVIIDKSFHVLLNH